TVFERFDGGGNFQHAVANGVQAVGFVGFSEQFGFRYARAVGNGDELHRFAGDLVEKALLDDQAARNDLLAEVLAEAVDRAIRIPGDVRTQFERMTADRVAEEFLFGAEAREPGGFGASNGGRAREAGGRTKPALTG